MFIHAFHYSTAKCDSCGRLGVKRTFSSKSRNFCSLACSKIMGKKGDGAQQVGKVFICTEYSFNQALQLQWGQLE